MKRLAAKQVSEKGHPGGGVIKGPWKFAKRMASKARRRLGRMLLDDAPRRDFFRGYEA